jgi:hypothetical protein
VLTAFDYPVKEATSSISGASSGKVSVDQSLRAVVTGASCLLYRGNPSVTTSVSGGSAVARE